MRLFVGILWTILSTTSRIFAYDVMTDIAQISTVAQRHLLQSDEKIDERLDELSTDSAYILATIVTIFLLLTLFGWIDSRFIHYNELFEATAIIGAMLYTTDFISDFFFCIQLFVAQKTFYFLLSIMFIIVPIGLNLYQLNRSIKTWVRDTETREVTSLWIHKYLSLLYFVSIISASSFTAVKCM